MSDTKENHNKLELMERYLREQRGSLDELQRLGLEQGPEPTIVSLDTTQSVSSEECHSLSDYSSHARNRSDWSDSSLCLNNPSAIENLTYLSKRGHSSSLELYSDDDFGPFPRIDDFQMNQISIEGHETVNYHLKHRISSQSENERIPDLNNEIKRKVRRLRKSINLDSSQYKPPPSKTISQKLRQHRISLKSFCFPKKFQPPTSESHQHQKFNEEQFLGRQNNEPSVQKHLRTNKESRVLSKYFNKPLQSKIHSEKIVLNAQQTQPSNTLQSQLKLSSHLSVREESHLINDSGSSGFISNTSDQIVPQLKSAPLAPNESISLKSPSILQESRHFSNELKFVSYPLNYISNRSFNTHDNYPKPTIPKQSIYHLHFGKKLLQAIDNPFNWQSKKRTILKSGLNQGSYSIHIKDQPRKYPRSSKYDTFPPDYLPPRNF